jgi:hypothetical protein
MNRCSIFEDQVIEFADDKSRDKQFAEISRYVKTQFVDPVMRAKLQIEVRMRHLKALRPARWGDVSTLITKDACEYMSNLSDAELGRRIAEIEQKDAFMKQARTA